MRLNNRKRTLLTNVKKKFKIGLLAKVFEFQTSSLDHIELSCVPLFNSKVPESPCDNDLNRNNI